MEDFTPSGQFRILRAGVESLLAGRFPETIPLKCIITTCNNQLSNWIKSFNLNPNEIPPTASDLSDNSQLNRMLTDPQFLTVYREFENTCNEGTSSVPCSALITSTSSLPAPYPDPAPSTLIASTSALPVQRFHVHTALTKNDMILNNTLMMYQVLKPRLMNYEDPGNPFMNRVNELPEFYHRTPDEYAGHLPVTNNATNNMHYILAFVPKTVHSRTVKVNNRKVGYWKSRDSRLIGDVGEVLTMTYYGISRDGKDELSPYRAHEYRMTANFPGNNTCLLRIRRVK